MSVNSVDQKVANSIEHGLKNKLTLKCTAETAKLLNNTSNPEYLIPEKDIKSRIKEKFPYEYFVICVCENLVKYGEICQNCRVRAEKNSKKENFVVSIPILPQIKSVLLANYDKIMTYLAREHENGVNTDVDDGIAFKNIASKYPTAKILGLTMNIDGANIHKSSKRSLWLTQLYQNYLPPNERFRSENILITACYYGVKKPNPFYLVSFLARELENCEFSISDGTSIHQFVPTVVITNCDLPARAMLQNFKGPVGRSACPVCYEVSEPVLNRKNKTTIRYVNSAQNYELRTHEETISKANALTDQIDSIDGVKGHSCMLLFDHFNIVDNFASDFMHGIALGVAKDIIEIWIGIRKIPDPKNNMKIKLKNAHEKDCFNQRILQLKPLMTFKRKPRSIFDISSYKATEVSNFLLYYSRFSLLGLLPTQVMKYFEILSVTTFILNKSRITDDELEKAEMMLIEFADKFENI